MKLLDVMNKYNQEVWIGIEGYPKYLISSFGNVKNLKTGRILKPRYNNKGYAQVGLRTKDKTTNVLIHRLVAEAFLPNPENLDTVDHINSDHKNNRVDNLQWLTLAENTRKGRNKRVNQYYKNGEYIATYESAKEASRQTGIDHSYICHCCEGKYKTAGQYRWKFV